jgi:predicted ATPase
MAYAGSTEMTTAITAPAAARFPSEPNSFVGRERDLADLAMLLADVRMLTLCGPGGVGKTRLAGRLASQLSDRFDGGAWLVELADAADPALAAVRVAAVLGIREEPDRPVIETLADALRPRQLLLVLDTCEHLIEAIADLAHRLLTDCPGVRILATSREPLRVRGETVWRVPPLALPSPGPARTGRGRGPGGVRGDPAVPRSRRGRPARIRPHGAERARRRRAVPDAGRHPAGHRAGRCPDAGAVSRADFRPAR